MKSPGLAWIASLALLVVPASAVQAQPSPDQMRSFQTLNTQALQKDQGARTETRKKETSRKGSALGKPRTITVGQGSVAIPRLPEDRRS